MTARADDADIYRIVSQAFVAGCQSVLDAVIAVRTKQIFALETLDGLTVTDSLINGLRQVISEEKTKRGLDGPTMQ
jgi:hypothetical protein